MHLIKDEAGNVIQHGHEAHADHCGSDCCGNGHGHDRENCAACQSGEGCKDEAIALLTYMVQHNEHHAAELDQLADNLVKLGLNDVAKMVKDGVTDFQKANMRFSIALSQAKEHLKEA